MIPGLLRVFEFYQLQLSVHNKAQSKGKPSFLYRTPRTEAHNCSKGGPKSGLVRVLVMEQSAGQPLAGRGPGWC